MPSAAPLSLATLEASPLLLAPLLPDAVALGCHAAAAVGGQEEAGGASGTETAAAGLVAVPLKGVEILRWVGVGVQAE